MPSGDSALVTSVAPERRAGSLDGSHVKVLRSSERHRRLYPRLGLILFVFRRTCRRIPPGFTRRVGGLEHGQPWRRKPIAEMPQSDISPSRLILTDFIDVDDLQALQDRFASLTGIATSIRDETGLALTRPAEKPRFCEVMQSSFSGKSACLESHAEAAALVDSADQPCRAKCHAGLCQAVAPIMLNGRHLGTIIVGDRPEHQLTSVTISALAEEHGLNEDELREAAEELRPWADERMTRATLFVQQLANTIARLCFNAYQLRCRMDDLSAMHGVGLKLAGRTRLQEILDTATRLLVETMELKAAGIRLLDEETGVLEIASVCNLSPEYLDKKAILASESEIDQAVLSGETVYIRDLSTDPRNFYQEKAQREGLGSVLVTSLKSGGRPLGVIRAYMDRVTEFGEFDRALLEAIASQVAAAIVNARLRRDAAEAERLDRQLKLAADVQRRMFPSEMPTHPHCEFGCIYEPHSELGGDFYDFIRDTDGTLGFGIADVVGKGVPASLIMASARSALRSHARSAANLSELMSNVNKRICEDTLVSEFVTMFFAAVSPDGTSMRYCNAGHEPMLRLRDGAIDALDEGGLVLGIDVDAQYEWARTDLRAGDVYVLVTDGVMEAMNYDGDAYGRERLEQSIRAHASPAVNMAPPLIAKQIMWDVRRFVGLAKLSDDLTVVVLRVS